MKFNELGLSEKVLNAVETAGYDTPTPIQAQAIPHALQGRDVLGIAQTGTGKTAAFTLPMLSVLERGRAKARMPRTLILEPTRELAAQVEEAFVKYGVNHKLNVALLIGGVSDGEQKTKIDRGADVVIATPGRLLDLTERGGLLLTGIEILVIDEADRMLDMGFIPDIERICKLVPFTRQTLFFSATMPPEITRLTEAFLHNPVRVEVSRAATTAENITQTLVPSGGAPHDKRATLRRIISGADNFKNAIIFCNRKRDVQVVYRSLAEARLLRRRAARRPRPAGAHGRAGRLPRRPGATAHMLRRRGARPRHSGRQPCHQLRRAASFRGLRPPHRPHGPCGQGRPGADHRHPRRLEGDRRDREADRPQDRLARGRELPSVRGRGGGGDVHRDRRGRRVERGGRRRENAPSASCVPSDAPRAERQAGGAAIAPKPRGRAAAAGPSSRPRRAVSGDAAPRREPQPDRRPATRHRRAAIAPSGRAGSPGGRAGAQPGAASAPALRGPAGRDRPRRTTTSR